MLYPANIIVTDGLAIITYRKYHWIHFMCDANAMSWDVQNPSIFLPSDVVSYTAGEKIEFSASANDLNQGYIDNGYTVYCAVALSETADGTTQGDLVGLNAVLGTDETAQLLHTFLETDTYSRYILTYRLILKDQNKNDCYTKTMNIPVWIYPRSLIDPLQCFGKIPEIGSYGGSVYTCETEQYTLTGQWYQVGGNGTLSTVSTFLPQTTYRFVAEAYSKPGYRFHESMSFWYTDEDTNKILTGRLIEGRTDYSYVRAACDITLPGMIDKIEAELPDIDPGANPANVTISDNVAVSAKSSLWYEYDVTTGKTLKMLELTDTFETGVVYLLQVGFQAFEGYEFADDISCFLSGKEAAYYNDAGDYIWFNYIFQCRKEARNVEFSMPRLIEGMTPAVYTEQLTFEVDCPGSLKLVDIVWHDASGNILSEDYVFEKSRKYDIIITMETADAVSTIHDEIKAALNGYSMISLPDESGDSVSFTAVLGVQTELTSLTIGLPTATVNYDGMITLPALIVGELLPVPTAPKGTRITEYVWTANCEEVSESAKAETDKLYECEVTLKPESAYYFGIDSKEDVFFSDNTTADSIVCTEDTCKVCSVPYRPLVNSIAVDGITAPVSGEIIPDAGSFGTVITDGSRFKTGTPYWTMMDQGETFTAGQECTLMMRFEPEEYSWFTTDLRFTLNGSEVDIFTPKSSNLMVSVPYLALEKLDTSVKAIFKSESAPIVGRSLIIDVAKTVEEAGGEWLDAYLAGDVAYQWFCNGYPVGTRMTAEDEIRYPLTIQDWQSVIYAKLYCGDSRIASDSAFITLPTATVDVVIKAPVTGESAEKVTVENSDGLVIAASYWMHGDTKFTGVFEAGETYTVVLEGAIRGADLSQTGFTVNGYAADFSVNSVLRTITLKMDFETVSAGVTVAGTITTYGDVSEITVTLESADAESSFEPKVWKGSGGADTPADYSFTNVPEGNYTITVEKANHVKRVYEITVQ